MKSMAARSKYGLIVSLVPESWSWQQVLQVSIGEGSERLLQTSLRGHFGTFGAVCVCVCLHRINATPEGLAPAR